MNAKTGAIDMAGFQKLSLNPSYGFQQIKIAKLSQINAIAQLSFNPS
ncbi:MAG: hypothetical protein AAFO04_25925 [Cyanobacteria bacterium J06592_8]